MEFYANLHSHCTHSDGKYTPEEIVKIAKDEGYKAFQCPLMPTVDPAAVLGIRVPILRKYAKSLHDYEDFLRDLPHRYFEENNLHGFLIERETDYDRCILLLEEFLPFVDNWATCDGIKPKALRRQPEKLMPHILRWLEADGVYTVRYAINLLMSWYLEEHFETRHLQLVAGIRSGEYYINMMRAWYFATALAKQYPVALPYIENRLLDPWTHNKTIQKAVESYRITAEQKEHLKTFRIKA